MRYRVSSSIENFAPGLKRKYPTWKEWTWFTRHEPTVFYGMYHIGDVARLVWHLGQQTVFWCGSDVLNMQKSPFLLSLVLGCKAKHICENEVEQKALAELGIDAKIKPNLFDPVIVGSVSYQSGRKQIYISCHDGREMEYGVVELMHLAKEFPHMDFHFYGSNYQDGNDQNVWVWGKVPHDEFVEDISKYHCAVRLNKFDGFSEILARSALLGQYQISRIEYPHMFTAKDTDDLRLSLALVNVTTEPNLEGRDYWIKKLSESII